MSGIGDNWSFDLDNLAPFVFPLQEYYDDPEEGKYESRLVQVKLNSKAMYFLVLSSPNPDCSRF